ncbi:UV DNA damage repair endonuclease UvsE [Tellurirhabdus bombi]|uniref:UV DNA damage repair endonuclease UvsE n=1 Tax=Tellurirhabdus bombi TaxID=2907205 RepID=UPI001F3BE0FC|nr:UV DNA damage repair endonuclease UvsE [Tellurirhabdus bombi]
MNESETTRMNIGYACINLTLHTEGITTNRGMIKRTYSEKGIQYASELALKNVQDLLRIVNWNIENDIKIFRVTSDLFPWASEYKLAQLPDFTEIRNLLEEIGKRPIRLTTHPGPFNKLAGEGTTLANTIVDLETHSEIFDWMGLPASHWNKINIHVGGAYGDKAATLQKFIRNFSLLSANLQKRLTVENDDKAGLYTIGELYPLHEAVGIPLVFDYFHHRLYPGNQTQQEAFEMAYSTWDVRPIFHYSDSRKDNEDPSCKREAHSDWVYGEINTYGKDVDIMLETKMKDLSVRQYWEKFGQPQL